MKKYTTLMGRLFDAGDSIRKVKLSFIKIHFLDKEIPPKYLLDDTLALVKQCEEELVELKKILLKMKNGK